MNQNYQFHFQSNLRQSQVVSSPSFLSLLFNSPPQVKKNRRFPRVCLCRANNQHTFFSNLLLLHHAVDEVDQFFLHLHFFVQFSSGRRHS